MDTRYVIFDTSEISYVDFSQIEDNSSYTIRRSVNGLKCLCEYITPMPSTLSSLSTKSIEHTSSEMQSITSGLDWSIDEHLD